MKKVLIISGSPRKRGNTMRIVKILENLMKKEDQNVEFKYLHLIDKELKWCRGCWRLNCLNKGGTSCPLNDDSKEIKADSLLWSFTFCIICKFYKPLYVLRSPSGIYWSSNAYYCYCRDRRRFQGS